MNKCPQCGYVENTMVKLQSNVMNEYVDAATGKVACVMNSEAERHTVKDKKLVRKDVFLKEKQLAASKPVEAAPAKK